MDLSTVKLPVRTANGMLILASFSVAESVIFFLNFTCVSVTLKDTYAGVKLKKKMECRYLRKFIPFISFISVTELCF